MTRSWRLVAVAVLSAMAVSACGGPSTPTGPVAFTADCPAALATWSTTPQAAPDTPPDLPEGAPVGRGVLVFRTCEECGALLLTESGRVYNLPPIPMPPLVVTPTDTPSAGPLVVRNEPLDPMHDVRLSPDGRWLARPEPGGIRLRDLTTTEVRRLDRPVSDRLAWSDDGRWLVVSDRQPTTLWDLDSGASMPLNVAEPYQDWRIAGILGPHEVLLAQSYDQERRDPDRRHETYVTVDPATGDIRHEYAMDFGDDGNSVVHARLIVAVTDSAEAAPSEVVISDLFQGRVVARYPLPAETPGRFTFWGATRTPGDGILLIRDYSYAGPPPRADPVQMFTLDPATGERRLACTLPPMTAVVVRR